MAGAIVIDETGEVVEMPRVLAGRRGASAVSFAGPHSEHAICQLGWVIVRPLRHNLQIMLRPDRLPAAAFIRLAYLIRENTATVAVLSSWHPTGFEHRIVQLCETTLARLAGLAETSPARLSRLAIARQRLPLLLRRCLEAWCDGSAMADSGRLVEAVQRLTNDRYVAFERVTAGSPQFLLHSYGSNNPRHALSWYHGRIGQPLRADDLDLAYHWFCNGAYRSALDLGHPLSELVEARLQIPNAALLHRRYTRIILPVQGRGRQLVLVATEAELAS